MAAVRIMTVVATLFTILTSASSSWAGIISVSGDVAVVLAPASVQEGALESDFDIFIFVEQQNSPLASDLRVNLTAPGLYDDRSDLPFPVPTLPTGTEVNSYFVHADPVTQGITYVGSITFDTDVLGVMLGGVLLSESDAILGSFGTSYPTFDSARGLALSGQDTITLAADGRTLTLMFTTRQVIDQVRVVTAPQPIPEPATLVLVGSAVAMMSVRQRRRRR